MAKKVKVNENDSLKAGAQRQKEETSSQLQEKIKMVQSKLQEISALATTNNLDSETQKIH